jgi:hypothetical protein
MPTIPFLIGAGDVELDHTRVYHYRREELKPGEALSPSE